MPEKWARRLEMDCRGGHPHGVGNAIKNPLFCWFSLNKIHINWWGSQIILETSYMEDPRWTGPLAVLITALHHVRPRPVVVQAHYKLRPDHDFFAKWADNRDGSWFVTGDPHPRIYRSEQHCFLGWPTYLNLSKILPLRLFGRLKLIW